MSIILTNITDFIKKIGSKIKNFIIKYPIPFAVIALLILLALLIVNDRIYKSKLEEQNGDEINKPIEVNVYKASVKPYIQTQGQVSKSGIIDIYAQTSGIVNDIKFTEGDPILRNQNIIYIATNYNGGNAQTISRRIAEKNYSNISSTLDTQKELIELQKEIAEKSDDNNDELREIKERSIKETKDLISQNKNIISELDVIIDETDDLTSKISKAQIQAGLNQQRNALRALEYEIDGDNPPAQLSGLSRDVTLKQLELQEKSLVINKEISQLQLTLARIQESLSYPVSPIDGTIDKIFVSENDVISPGMKLFTIRGADSSSEITALVKPEIARNIDITEPSRIIKNGDFYSAIPSYITEEQTGNQMHTVFYNLDTEENNFNNNQYIKIEIPVLSELSNGQILIPIDAVFQTQNGDFVYVVQDGKSVSKQVTLGDVIGNFISIKDGLSMDDEVILNRNVFDGSEVVVRS